MADGEDNSPPAMPVKQNVMKHKIFSILLSLLAFTLTVWADGGNWKLNTT